MNKFRLSGFGMLLFLPRISDHNYFAINTVLRKINKHIEQGNKLTSQQVNLYLFCLSNADRYAMIIRVDDPTSPGAYYNMIAI